MRRCRKQLCHVRVLDQYWPVQGTAGGVFDPHLVSNGITLRGQHGWMGVGRYVLCRLFWHLWHIRRRVLHGTGQHQACWGQCIGG